MGLRAVRAWNPANVAITGGNTPFVWAHYKIPLINAASGSIGDNGALTLGTALGTTYASAYVLVPANAIAAGVPAAPTYYYAQFSSTTAATLFNNTLAANLDSKGGPTIPASPAAFVTTGPGAYTAATGASTIITLALPASTIGTTGELTVQIASVQTNNANAKTVASTFGGTTIISNSVASTAAAALESRILNRNSASVQALWSYHIIGSAATTAMAYGAVNTAASVNIVFLSTHGTATDNVVLESIKLTAFNPPA